MTKKANEIEVVNAEQAQVIDAAKAYSEGFQTASRHRKGYGLLFGAELNQLKEITPHGQFEQLASQTFPEYSDRWLRELMAFASALAPKTELSSVLKSGQLLLELPGGKREKLFAEVDKKMGDRGIKEFVLDYRKKQNKEKLKAEPKPSPEQAATAKLKAASDMVKSLKQSIAIARINKDLVLVPDAELQALEDERIELGNFLKLLRKNRKAANKGGKQ